MVQFNTGALRHGKQNLDLILLQFCDPIVNHWCLVWSTHHSRFTTLPACNWCCLSLCTAFVSIFHCSYVMQLCLYFGVPSLMQDQESKQHWRPKKIQSRSCGQHSACAWFPGLCCLPKFARYCRFQSIKWELHLHMPLHVCGAGFGGYIKRVTSWLGHS